MNIPFPFVHDLAYTINLCLLRQWRQNACWYFVASTSDTRTFSMIPVTASEIPGIGANNASTFHIAITRNQAIVNYELFRKRTESPVQHFNQRVFRGVIYNSAGKPATKLCR